MTNPRFYMQSLREGEHCSLSADDSKHAVGVLRLRNGDRVHLFDGKGTQAAGEIVCQGKNQVAVWVDTIQPVCREVPKRLEMAIALPKGDRQKQLIDMLVQLGVDSLTPLVCSRSVAQPTSNALDRLRRAVIESCKQCGRNQLMCIRPPKALCELEVKDPSASGSGLRLFAHPYGPAPSLQVALHEDKSDTESNGCVVIGPEGGFASDEVQWLTENHWQQVHLGSRILRIETAAIAVASAWMLQHEAASQ